MANSYCPEHGSYDSSFGQCPYCLAMNQPQAPQPLSWDIDNTPTELGMGEGNMPQGGSEDPTELGANFNYASGSDSEEMTELGIRYHQSDETELDFVDESSQALLWVKDGINRGRTFKIKGGTIIGRTEGDLTVEDPKASNPHAKFTLEEDNFFLWDFGSKNGTYVNGERIRAATQLKENDLIRIGDTTYVFKVL